MKKEGESQQLRYLQARFHEPDIASTEFEENLALTWCNLAKSQASSLKGAIYGPHCHILSSRRQRGVKMASKDDVDYADLVQLASSSEKVSALIDSLKSHIKMESVPERGGYTVIESSPEGSTVLQKIREEFKNDFERSKEVSD